MTPVKFMNKKTQPNRRPDQNPTAAFSSIQQPAAKSKPKLSTSTSITYIYIKNKTHNSKK